MNTKLPPEIEEAFASAAKKAVEYLRDELERPFIIESRSNIVATLKLVFNQVYLPSIESEINYLASQEFERIKNEYIGKLLSGLAQNFMQGKQ